MAETYFADYPFRCVFSLRPLIDYLREQERQCSADNLCAVQGLNEMLARVPELHAPIEDLSILDRHQELLKELMRFVFPPAFWETQAVGALVPFCLDPVFVSPPFKRLLLNEDGTFRGMPSVEQATYVQVRLMRAYFLILKKLYGIHLDIEYPLIRIIPDAETGLDRYYQIKPDLRFVDVLPAGEKTELSEQDRRTILEHLTEPDVIRGILPPERFEFRGFSIFHVIDVTDSEVVSALERDLIDQESIFSQAGFIRLQGRLRTLFKSPGLVAGISALREDQVLMLNNGCEIKQNCIFSDSHHIPISEFKGSVFERAVEARDVVHIPDLTKEANRASMDEEIIQAGVRAFLVAPLEYQRELLGALYLGSPVPGELGPMDAMRLKNVIPLFSMALKRALDELNNQVQAIIKEKCTALHPSVEWRFRQAAFHYLEHLRMGRPSEFEPIVFKEVYPLYGATDIRGSSEARDRAIREDLTEQLQLALQAIQRAGEAASLPLLPVIAHRIQRHLERIEGSVSGGDESAITGFLSREVEPVFPHIRGLNPRVNRAVELYEAAVDPRSGSVFRKRREFEGSVSRLNGQLSAYLDAEEAQIQAAFPHYFEKHKTDGVDYLIYTGRSMVETGGFDAFHLRNLRFWQLKVACGLAWHAEQVKSQMSVPLDVAHLILVQHAPMSIRFRFDEKRFEPDGTYDIRNEIVKSRLDKAVVKGGRERLTQPGKIAIVYSQPQEAREIRQYIDYLQAEGYLNGDLESFDVEGLPGVRGLKALRVSVNLESEALLQRVERMAG